MLKTTMAEELGCRKKIKGPWNLNFKRLGTKKNLLEVLCQSQGN
jgi:hypothetical protein